MDFRHPGGKPIFAKMAVIMQPLAGKVGEFRRAEILTANIHVARRQNEIALKRHLIA